MSYRGLRVWQVAMELVEKVYRLCEAFPAPERYGLTAQVRRAAVSVPSNIAEGQGRRTSAAFANHVGIARASVLEVETQVLIAVRLGFVSEEQATYVLSLCDDTARMLHGLGSSLLDAPDARRPTPDDEE